VSQNTTRLPHLSHRHRASPHVGICLCPWYSATFDCQLATRATRKSRASTAGTCSTSLCDLVERSRMQERSLVANGRQAWLAAGCDSLVDGCLKSVNHQLALMLWMCAAHAHRSDCVRAWVCCLSVRPRSRQRSKACSAAARQ
jgi:hypothetical protein